MSDFLVKNQIIMTIPLQQKLGFDNYGRNLSSGGVKVAVSEEEVL